MSSIDTPVQPAARANPFDSLRRVNEVKQREKALEVTRAQPKGDFGASGGKSKAARQVVTSAPLGDVFYESGLPITGIEKTLQPALDVPGKIEEASDRMHGRLASGYEALALAHKRFGQGVESAAEPLLPSSGSRPAKAVSVPGLMKTLPVRETIFTDVNREAGVMRALVNITAMASYYEISDAERQAVRDRLMAMDVSKLGAMIRAYEYAANHVAMMSDDKLARRAAMEADPKLKTFFEKHGTYDDVPDHSKMVPWSVQAPLVDTKDTGKTKKLKR